MKNEEKLSKILKCAYIIIALLIVDTIILLTANVKITTDSTKNNPQQEEPTQADVDYDVSMFKEVSMDEVIDLFDSKDAKVIYIGRATCGYCVKFLPMLQQAQDEYGYQTYYYDMDKLTDEDRQKILKKDNEDGFLEENFTATPMVLVVKDGELIGPWVGYNEYDEFAQFLEKYGFEK